jgi:serine/threonine protein kinase
MSLLNMPVNVQLKVVQGKKAGRIIVCEEGEIVFGRCKDCEKGALPEDDMKTSRLHFKLEVKGSYARVWDMRSMYGTIVNGTKHGGRGGNISEKIVLHNGDRIQAGEQIFEVMIAGDKVAKGDKRTADLGGLKLTVTDGPPAIEGYQIQDRLRRGGSGTSFLCKRKTDGNPVVIKVFRSRRKADEGTLDAFRAKIEPLCSLTHPNVIHIRDYGVASSCDGGAAFCFETEWCSLGSVGEIAEGRNGWLPPHDVHDFMLGALAGLSHAYEKGIVHGSIAPSNILVADQEGKKIPKLGDFADFALNRVFQRVGLNASMPAADDLDVLPFTAPEHAENPTVAEPSSDVWSIGAVFYHLLTGEYPRECSADDNQLEVTLKTESIPIRKRKPFNKKVPKGLGPLLDLIDRSLMSSPRDRFRNAPEMYETLRRIPRPEVHYVR